MVQQPQATVNERQNERQEILPGVPVGKSDFAASLQKKLALSHIPTLDGLRAMAVFLVIFYHCGFLLAPASLGLMMFFVLSGFLITWLLLRESEEQGSVSLYGFYRRRMLRIFPAFYAYWIGIVLLLLMAGKNILWPHAFSALFYAVNYYNAVHGDPGTAFSHTWSLAVEEQFYLLWPLAFIKLRNNLSKLTIFICGVILAVWLHRFVLCFVFNVDQAYFYSAFDARLDQIMMGCLLAVLLKRGVLMSFWKAVCSSLFLPVMVLMLLFASIYFGELLAPRYRDVFGFGLEPILIAILMVQAISFSSTLQMKWIEWPVVRYLGRISYSLYLYQQITVTFVQKQLEAHPEVLQLIVAVAFTIIMAAASYHIIERPFLRLKNPKLATGS
jgi:peptidoglycan/LPS O-acetylase OafA/YrhL